MTDHPMSGVPPAPEFETETVVAPKSWQRMAVIAISLALLTMMLTISVGAYMTWAEAREDERDSKTDLAQVEEISDLRADVRRLQADLNVDEDRAACRTLLGADITNEQVHVLAELGELIVVVATVNRENPDESRLRVRAAIDELDVATRRLVMATQVRDRYLADGSPLPCPLSGD